MVLRASAATGCADCGAQWHGFKTCHCSGCHNTFTAPTAFDRHRVGSHGGGRRCADPAKVDLVDAGRNYVCWMTFCEDDYPVGG